MQIGADIERSQAERAMVDNSRDLHEEGPAECWANHLALRHPHHSHHQTRWRVRSFAWKTPVRPERVVAGSQRERSISTRQPISTG